MDLVMLLQLVRAREMITKEKKLWQLDSSLVTALRVKSQLQLGTMLCNLIKDNRQSQLDL